VPGADDFGHAVDAKTDHRSGIEAGDCRGLFRDQLVDHLGRAHLGDGHGQVAQRRLLLEQILNARIDRRPAAPGGNLGAGCSAAHIERLTGRRGEGYRVVRVGTAEACG